MFEYQNLTKFHKNTKTSKLFGGLKLIKVFI